MKSLAILASAVLALTLGIGDAEAAKRLGSGKSFGMQRSVAPPAKPAATTPPSTTAAAPAASPAAAGAPATQAGRSWMGPVAGLAAGLGLAALASHLGFGEELASFLLMGLAALAVVALVAFFLRKRSGLAQPAFANAGAGLGAGGYQRSSDSDMRPANSHWTPGQIERGHASATAHIDTNSATPLQIPADFDVDGFLRNAKVQFIRLQAANDAGNLEDLRQFTTPEVFAELRLVVGERGDAPQTTDVVDLDAQLLELADEESRYIASVRFAGRIREAEGPVESIDEVWHLTKPRSGGGWMLAGIQQIS